MSAVFYNALFFGNYAAPTGAESGNISKMQAEKVISWGWYSLTAPEWATLSTVATLGAMLASVLAVLATAGAIYVAVSVPLRVANAATAEARRVEDERRADAESRAKEAAEKFENGLTMRYHEVASATYNSLDIINDAITAFRKPSLSDFLQCSARATAMSEALRVLIDKPDLTDGPIVAGAAAASAMDAVVRAGVSTQKFSTSSKGAAQHYRDNGFINIGMVEQEMDSALVLGHVALKRIDKVRDSRKISVRTGRPFPILPNTI